jgi:hypothetical protein
MFIIATGLPPVVVEFAERLALQHRYYSDQPVGQGLAALHRVVRGLVCLGNVHMARSGALHYIRTT